MTDQPDLMSEESQRAHIVSMFRTLFANPDLSVFVTWTETEEIVASFTEIFDPTDPSQCRSFFLMEIGSDDDHYRFELWLDGRDTGVYVEFAFPGETL
jgi:hypothetical protein